MSVSGIAAKIVFPNHVQFCSISDFFKHVKSLKRPCDRLT